MSCLSLRVVLARCIRDCLACPRALRPRLSCLSSRVASATVLPVLAHWSSPVGPAPVLPVPHSLVLPVPHSLLFGPALSETRCLACPCALVLARCVRACLACPRPLVLACWSSARLACPAPVGSAPVVLPVPSLCPFFVSLLCRSLRLAVPRVARCLAAPGTWFCARLACPGSSPGSGLTAIHNRHNLLPNNGLRPITSAGVCAVVAPKLRRQISGNLAVFSAIATDVGRSICLPSSSRAATTLGRRSPASP